MGHTFSASHKTDAFLFMIDNDQSMQKMIAAALSIEAYWVYALSSAREALHLAASVLPDVYIIDYEFSGMTGLQLYEQLQAKSEYIPCIFLSAPRSLVAWRTHPIWNIQEPFDIDELLGCVKEALQQVSSGLSVYS